MNVTVNSVYQNEFKDETIYERVLWFDRPQNTVIVVRMTEEKKKLYLPEYRTLSEFEESLEGGVVKRTVDPFDRIIDPKSVFFEKHVKKRDKRWERIKDLVNDKPDIYNPRLRNASIQALSTETKVSTRTYYNDLKQFWKGGQTINALLPLYDNCGGKGKRRIITAEMKAKAKEEGREIPKRGVKSSRKVGVNIDEDILEIIRKSVAKCYATTQKTTLRETYQYMLRNYFSVGEKMIDGVRTPQIDPKGRFPTLEAFKYHLYKDQDLRQTIIKRKGEKRFNLESRTVLKSSLNDQMGPGSVFQIDAAVSNVYIVNRYDRERLLKKPTIYIVQDVMSRVIVGVHVGINPPSWQGTQLALFDAFTNSKLYSVLEGFEEGADTCLTPKILVADNGSEFISITSDALSGSSLDIIHRNAPPYRADLKGIVESTIGLVKHAIRNLPGGVKKGYKERGEVDHRQSALLDIDEFRVILNSVIKQHNFDKRMDEYQLAEDMTKDGVKRNPMELWKWGIQNRGGDLKEISKRNAMINLLPRGEAQVKKSGIDFKDMSYSCDVVDEEQWYEKARANNSWKVPIAYDPRNASQIYIILENGKQIEVAMLLERNRQLYANYTFDEIHDLSLKEKQEKHDDELQLLQSKEKPVSVMNDFVSNRNKLNESNGVPNKLRTKDIEENSKVERAQENKEEAKFVQKIIRGDHVLEAEKNEQQPWIEEEPKKFLSKEKSLFHQLKEDL
ncbi:Mu transposase C-terminal domain-containing protein [Salipaludibacillus sp. CF4.18]|uniref:Mu transposase C-terminal domain-containing protein n=1 Tax=Salipaludibacillus sp. CF4.18 TaxID=3373081 RepID=UPI003EE79391